MYDDLVATGQSPWRLWAQLPLDLLRVRAWTLPFTGLQTAGAPTAVAAVERTALQAALRVVAVLAHLSWLTTHVVIAYPWWLAQRRATEMLGHSPTYEDWARYPYSWGPDPLIELADERAGAALPYLLLSFPVVAILGGWLPRKGSFALCGWWFGRSACTCWRATASLWGRDRAQSTAPGGTTQRHTCPVTSLIRSKSRS